MRKLLILVVLLIGFCCGEVRAQSTSASLTGYITDPTKAVIVDAKVIVINVDTSVRYEATTNETGSYDLTNLPPGKYRMEVEKPGFKTVVKSDIELHLQDTIAINFEMVIGSEAGATMINTTDASVSTVVDRNFAENLPMNGRSFQTLIQLTPGVVTVPSNPSDGGQFSVNGQRASSNYWMVDGVSANIGVSSNSQRGNGPGGTLASFSAQGGTNSLVSVDAMREFRIETSTYAPEFGRTPGAQISILTRSGTNQVHGTAFDYLRNDLFDANDWFGNRAGLKKPEERQNDFGGTFNGPILKNRTFFFFSYEGLRLRLPQVGLTTVPDVTARQNAVPAMKPYLNSYPLPTPNAPDNTAIGVAQFNSSFSNKATLDAYSLRIDHRLTNKISLFGRYNYSPSEIDQRGNGRSLNIVSPSRITTQTATMGGTWNISPTVTNDLRFNYSRTNGSTSSFQDNFGGAVPLASLPFPSPFTSQHASFVLRVFSLKGSLIVGHNAQNLQQQINVVDNLSAQKGSHSLKFGVDFRRLSPKTAPPLYTQAVIFRNVAPSFEMGRSFLGATQSFADLTLLFHNLGIFAQDTWRIAPRLTLTYGLRWDLDFAPSSASGPSIPAVTGYNLNDFSQLAIAPSGTPAFKTTYGNVAPRLGLAYQLIENQNWQTVLRGGFGAFYDLVSSETGNLVGFGGGPPFFANTTFFGATFPFDSAHSAPTPIPPTGDISNVYAFNPSLKQPYTLEWNIALEQALGKQQTISASYIGAAGRRLLQTTEVISPSTNPNIGTGNFIDNIAASNYNALQIQFQRRLSHGLQALGSYTWSHSIDTGSAGSTQLASNAGTPGSNSNANRGPSDFDIRHAFSVGLTYDLPTPRTSAFTYAILGGWSLQSIIQVRSAPPVDIFDSNPNFTSFNNGVLADIRPDIVPGQAFYLFGAECASVFQASGDLGPGQSCPGGKGFNPAAFTDPPADPNTGNPVRQGTAPRNFLRGFGATQWDFAVHRDFPIRESLKLQFRAEMFNALNHPNFGPPNGAFVSPQNGGPAGFGLSSLMLGPSLAGHNLGGGAFDPLYQLGGPRSIQFALKLVF